MQDKPDARSLLEQVESELRLGVPPGFQQRVAANAIALARRELELKPGSDTGEFARLFWLLDREGTLESLNEALCAAIRDRSFTVETPGLTEHLLDTVREKIAIDQPSYPAFRAEKEEREHR